MKHKNLIITILLILLDQITKFICLQKLKPIGSLKIIEKFFYLTYVENRGAAFGILQGARYIFIFLTISVLIICFYYYKKIPKNKFELLTKTSLTLIISGAIGNLIDRIFRGFVIDMFHFIFWANDFAVFNMADIFVVLGTFLLAVVILFNDIKKDKEVA